MRPKLSYANVMSTMCFFLLLGGGAYAAGHLGKNSVGSKQLKKNSVTTAKIKKGAVTAAKVKNGTLTGTQINASTLGTVPSANVANALTAPEAVHLVGAPGEPAFQGGSSNVGALGPIRLQSAGFYKDHEGVVHLQGFVKVGESGAPPGAIFTLPPGYRPASGTLLLFEQQENYPATIYGPNTTVEGTAADGLVSGIFGKYAVLDGITFRAES